MKASIGDWLFVKSRTTDQHARRGQILDVGVEGGPPYTVHWLDDDRTAIVIPGPDAEVIDADHLAERDRLQAEHIASAQSPIAHGDAHH